MKVSRIAVTTPKINALKLANSINKAEVLPTGVTKEQACKVLKTGYLKRLCASLGTITGGFGLSMGVIDNAFKTIDSIWNIVGIGALMATPIVAAILSIKNDKIDNAYEKIQGEEILETVFSETKTKLSDKLDKYIN